MKADLNVFDFDAQHPRPRAPHLPAPLYSATGEERPVPRAKSRRLALRGFGALSVLALGCTSPTGEIALDSRGEITADGLYPVKRSSFHDAWVKPGADVSSYDKIWLELASVSYKRHPDARRHRGTRSNFALSDRQMDDFRRYFLEEFERELAKDELFGLTEAAGPTVLRIQAHIIDLIVKVPTEQSARREFIFTSSTAKMTLILELYDSISGEILARVADRREARQPGRDASDLYYSSSVTNVDALRRTFRRWARILRRRLDEVAQLGPIELPAEGSATPDPS